MNYFILDLGQTKEWTECLNKLPGDQQDIYYTPEYYSLYENYGNGKAMCFVFESDNDFAFYPFLMNSVNELGYDLDGSHYDIQGSYGYNGVISSSFKEDFIKSFYEKFNFFCKSKNIVAEFTRFHPVLNNNQFSKHFLEIHYDRETVILNLKVTYDDIWKNDYTSVNRNRIRKAKGNNVQVIFDESLEGLLNFAELYRSTMDDLNAFDFYKFNNTYFNNIHNFLKNNYDLILAYKDNELIAGSLFLFYRDYYHFHLSSRKREYQTYGANNLILDEAVKKAKQRGSTVFHFGGGIDNTPDNGLLKFKSRFSSKRGKFYIGKKIYNQEVYQQVIKKWDDKNSINNEKSDRVLLRYRNL